MNEATQSAYAVANAFGVHPSLVNGTLKEGTRITPVWSLDEAHTTLPGLSSHSIIAYYGKEQPISWFPQGQKYVASTRPGTITIIPRDWEGYFDLGGTIMRSSVYLTTDRLQSSAENLTGSKDFELFGRLGFDDPTVAQILKLISQEECLDDPASRLFVEQAIDLLCTHLLRAHSSLSAPHARRRRGGLASWQVKRISDYMNEHLDQMVELDELANILGLSRFHFSKAFRVATGMPPYQFLQNLRMLRAKELLLIPEMPVVAIALAVGYHTQSAFASTFRKIVGSTPTDFRRQVLDRIEGASVVAIYPFDMS